MPLLLGVITDIREQDPLKQGLKRDIRDSIYNFIIIREQDPLKQGLKRDIRDSIYNFIIIREQDPLKQGLKQVFKREGSPEKDYSRARSTKTRIETRKMYAVVESVSNSRARSTKTRIETARCFFDSL